MAAKHIAEKLQLNKLPLLSLEVLVDKYSGINFTAEQLLTDKELFPQSKKKDGRKTAKKDEDKRVQWLCDQINQCTELGIALKQSFYIKFGVEINYVEKKGGNQDHYDFMIYLVDGTTRKCEEKGSGKYKNINTNTPPYENSVEFFNGQAKLFTVCFKYLRLWYDMNVDNPDTNHEYSLPKPPVFEEWLDGGPYCMTNPKSDYSIQLKENYRGKYPGMSMNGYNHDNKDYREGPNNQFTMTDDDKKQLINEVQKEYDRVMKMKEVWLQTSGVINGDFTYEWYDKIEPKKIVSVELLKKKDIYFIFHLEDNTSFKGIMRWGKGCGFSCFRMDFK